MVNPSGQGCIEEVKVWLCGTVPCPRASTEGTVETDVAKGTEAACLGETGVCSHPETSSEIRAPLLSHLVPVRWTLMELC